MAQRFYDFAVENAFPLYAPSAGFNLPQLPRRRPDGLHMHQVMLVNAGRGVLIFGNRQYDLKAGDMLFLRADEPHYYYGTDDAFYTSWVAFLGPAVEPLLQYFGVNGSCVYRGKHHGNFEAKVANLFSVFETDIAIPLLMGKAYDAVLAFFDEVLRPTQTPIESIKNYLERNFAKPLTLEDIFADCQWSKSKLCADFKQKYGETVFEMLTRIRLNNARSQLERDPAVRVKDVALSCGFNSCSYFCRMYRRMFGKSPKSI